MSDVVKPGKEATHFEHARPILSVANLDASLKYYIEVLGFKVNWQVPGFAEVSRDRCGIMLCEGEQGNPGTWVWIGVVVIIFGTGLALVPNAQQLRSTVLVPAAVPSLEAKGMTTAGAGE